MAVVITIGTRGWTGHFWEIKPGTALLWHAGRSGPWGKRAKRGKKQKLFGFETVLDFLER